MLDADNRNRLTQFLMLAIDNEHKRATMLALQYANEEMRADLLQREKELVEQSAAHVARTSQAQDELEMARKGQWARGLTPDTIEGWRKIGALNPKPDSKS